VSVDSRRIERLDLRVPRADDGQRAAHTIREALRLASLPGDGQPGRLFIRRLDLSSFSLEQGPGVLAVALSERIRQLRRVAVAIGDAKASEADAVFCRDELEPLLLALVRAAKGERSSEWFWPQLHAGLRPTLAPPELAAQVWELLAQRADVEASLPAVVGALLDVAARAEVFTAIAPFTARALLMKLGERSPAEPRWPELIERMAPARWRPPLREAILACRNDVRAECVIVAAVRAARPWVVATHIDARQAPPPESDERPDVERPPLPSAARRQLPSDAAPRSTRPHEPSAGLAPLEIRSDAGAEPSVRLATVDAPPPPSAAVTSSPPPAISAEPPPLDAAPPERLPVPRGGLLLDRPTPTQHGGLLFLLNPLRRLGLDAFLRGHADLERHGFGSHVLQRIADALQVPEEDPMRMPLRAASLPEDLVLPPAPSSWRDVLPSHAVPELRGGGVDALLTAWVDALGAFLEHVAELDAACVVQRPAAVTCSRTHVDVIFDMRASDVSIRKAGLDIDPGFVGWLGRVVRFHYVFGGQLDA
jgi:hypothetical protein